MSNRFKKNVTQLSLLILLGLTAFGIWRISTSFLTSVTVEIIAEGKPYTLKRTIRCVRVVSGRGFGSTTSYFYIPSVASFGVELPSGAAVVVVTPNVCNLYPPVTYGPGGDSTSWRMLFAEPEPINPDFVPLLAWVSDAKKQDEVQLFLTRELVSGDDKKLQFKSIKVEKTFQLSMADESDHFLAFPNNASYFSTKLRDVTYFSYYGVAVPSSEWSEFIELPPGVARSPTAVLLPAELTASAAKLFAKVKNSTVDFIQPYDPLLKGSEYFDPGSSLLGSLESGFVGVPPSIDIRFRSANSTLDQIGQMQDWRRVVPFRKAKGVFIALSGQRGTLHLQRLTGSNGEPMNYNESLKYRHSPHPFRIDQTEITSTSIKSYLYEPSAKEIWLIGSFVRRLGPSLEMD